MSTGRFTVKSNKEFHLTKRDLSLEVLIVDPDMSRGTFVKEILVRIGFRSIALKQDHLKALEDIQNRPLKIVLFSTAPSSISSLEFSQKMM